MTTNAAEVTTPRVMGLLEGIEVQKPEQSADKTRLYMCGIKRSKETERFEFQIRVGPAVFTTSTFEWKGAGENATQVFHDGAIQHFSDAQIAEIREKLKHRYIRYVKNKAGAITGVQDIDASDGGALVMVRGKDGIEDQVRRPPIRQAGRLSGDEKPLYELLVLEPIFGNPKLDGKTLTVADLKQMLAEAQAEEERLLEGGDAIFGMLEGGKGGKLDKASRAAPRDVKQAIAATTSTAKVKAEGGYIPDGK